MSGNIVSFLPNEATKVLVMVDGWAYNEIHGRWQSPYLPSFKTFDSCFDLISKIDEFYSQNSFVTPTTRFRSIKKYVAAKNFTKRELIRYMDESIFSQGQGKKATFIIQVMFRQNSTWQGTVKWVETGEETRFRSTMELMRMMDEIVCEQLEAKEEQAE